MYDVRARPRLQHSKKHPTRYVDESWRSDRCRRNPALRSRHFLGMRTELRPSSCHQRDDALAAIHVSGLVPRSSFPFLRHRNDLMGHYPRYFVYFAMSRWKTAAALLTRITGSGAASPPPSARWRRSLNLASGGSYQTQKQGSLHG